MRRRFLASTLAAALLAFGSPLLAGEALACCMCVMPQPPTASAPPGVTGPTGVLDLAGGRYLFVQDGDTTTAHIQVQYYGDATDFSLIVPVPAVPTVGIGSDALFTALRDATRPRFDLAYRTEGTCKPRAASGAAKRPSAPNAAAGAMPAPAATGVTVVAQRNVGPYATTTLKAEDPGALREWLTANGYRVPAKLDEAMAAYVAGKYYFVALKLQKDREAGDLQPVTLAYEAAKPGLPVRLSTLSAVPDMDMFVWVLGDQRAVPDTYNHVEINEARIDWMAGGNNYRQVVTEAMNEAGGKAFVTDYAGPASIVQPPPELATRAALDVTRLAGKTTRDAFVQAMREADYFQGDEAKLTAFLDRHAPAGAASVDVGKAIEDLRATHIRPAQLALQALRKHPYLTQLYTTMSPDEMADDPTFVFNADMPEVANVRRAEAITECKPDTYVEDAPIRIKLADGTSFYAFAGRESVDDTPKPAPSGGKAAQLPAARHVMKCGTVGQPRTVKDNQSQIVKVLNDLSKQGIALRITTSFGANPRAGAGTSIVITVPFAEQLAQAVAAGQGVTGAVAKGAGAVASGFGCAGCAQTNAAPPPVRQGAGEGATYALMFVGALGYRRWLGRRRR